MTEASATQSPQQPSKLAQTTQTTQNTQTSQTSQNTQTSQTSQNTQTSQTTQSGASTAPVAKETSSSKWLSTLKSIDYRKAVIYTLIFLIVYVLFMMAFYIGRMSAPQASTSYSSY
jgi:hypothetical protein